MMFTRRLILRQSFRVPMVAQQSVVKPFAALRRLRDRGPADDEAVVFDAGQRFEGFEVLGEEVFVRLGD